MCFKHKYIFFRYSSVLQGKFPKYSIPALYYKTDRLLPLYVEKTLSSEPATVFLVDSPLAADKLNIMLDKEYEKVFKANTSFNVPPLNERKGFLASDVVAASVFRTNEKRAFIETDLTPLKDHIVCYIYAGELTGIEL